MGTVVSTLVGDIAQFDRSSRLDGSRVIPTNDVMVNLAEISCNCNEELTHV
jgi:hypothetical protein